MKTSTQHIRVNDTLLAPLERPTLNWLAANSPAWINPDIYTTIGVIGGVIILVGYFLSRYDPIFFWLASLGFLINWYGDSLDGTLARYRRIERPVYGFFIDHTLDAVVQLFIFFGMGVSPYISFSVAMLTLVAYMLMSILVYIRTIVISEFRLSYGSLGPTEARLLAVLLNLAMFVFGKQIWVYEADWFGRLVTTPYDLAVGAIGLLLLFFFTNTAVHDARRLAKENR